ncbi:MAG: PDDEXK nuclease domain-containing protein [Flavobacteriaceae bacterium]|jgi:predicted nuclease of restriction endonuclease-like (RecB) superfamily|nr:PDDEXK nuclease domain-containing protein [Flavobacteriaceae bacterium]
MVKADNNILPYEKQFEDIRLIIDAHKRRAYRTANYEQIATYWEVGSYVSAKLKTSQWGSKIVSNLADYLKEKQPDIKGFDRRALYRMVQFYDTYSADEFAQILDKQIPNQLKEIVGNENPQAQNAENQVNIIVGNKNPQTENKLLILLSLINWSSHLEILSGCTSDKERLYYISLTFNEKLYTKELVRKIEISDYEQTKIGNNRQSKQMKNIYPATKNLFKDSYMVDYLNLPDKYIERDLQSGLVVQMKKFLLDLGGDFIFMGDEFRLQVGMNDFFVDLMFFHRGLQCLVAVEIKTTKFKPEYIGQLDFYLEALDRDVRKANENPSIGILLCKNADSETIRIKPLAKSNYDSRIQATTYSKRRIAENSSEYKYFLILSKNMRRKGLNLVKKKIKLKNKI